VKLFIGDKRNATKKKKDLVASLAREKGGNPSERRSILLDTELYSSDWTCPTLRLGTELLGSQICVCG